MAEPLFYSGPTNHQRLAMRSEPEEKPVMFQTWSQLLFLHWEWDHDEIRKKLPAGLYLDTFNGKAYVAVVPFSISEIRPALPFLPGMADFLELNVRTYVYDEQGRPGVWFFSLDCASAFATFMAKLIYCLPYKNAAMNAEIQAGHVRYSARRESDPQARTAEFRYTPRGKPMENQPGSLNFFLLERYLLFAFCARSEELYSARVFHDPYQLEHVEVGRCDNTFLELNGFNAHLRNPVHTTFAQPLRVKIYGPKLVP